jgi:hypothetical protein
MWKSEEAADGGWKCARRCNTSMSRPGQQHHSAKTHTPDLGVRSLMMNEGADFTLFVRYTVHSMQYTAKGRALFEEEEEGFFAVDRVPHGAVGERRERSRRVSQVYDQGRVQGGPVESPDDVSKAGRPRIFQ